MDKTSIREEYTERVAGPGKFEGEAAYVPYFWDRLDECDEDDGTTAGWTVTEEDVAIFPELVVGAMVWLCESESGFVYEVDGPEEDEGDYCERCGEEMDTDCFGSPRCPVCDEPCPGCSDQ